MCLCVMCFSILMLSMFRYGFFFFFNGPATTEIYTYCTLFPSPTRFRSPVRDGLVERDQRVWQCDLTLAAQGRGQRAARARRFLGRERRVRSEEHTSELQSLMRISYAVFCLKKKNKNTMMHILHNVNTIHDIHSY